MKKSILKFANRLLSKDQMRSIKGGQPFYCNCYGQLIYTENIPPTWNCDKWCYCYYGPGNPDYCQ
jgi:hypothetical protein